MGDLLASLIISDYLQQLDVKNGEIVVSSSNQNKVSLIPVIVNNFMQSQGSKIIVKMAADIEKITAFNTEYFKELTTVKSEPAQVKKIIDNRIGINPDGTLKRDGFMGGLMKNEEVKKEIQDYTLDKVTTGTGYEDLRKGLRTLIAGNDSEEKMGNFAKYYRNVAYDTYARIDAMEGKLWGDKLEMNCFIYAGTRRKTSRHFCIQRKGQVFTREEALEWKDLIGTTTVNEAGKVVPAGPIQIAEDIPTYDPFVDRGGYGCVDDIMWIGDDIALSMRPDLEEYFEEKKKGNN